MSWKEDMSPPRRSNQRDISPPRKKTNDISPRRKDNDLSPPRKNNDKVNIKQEEKIQTHGLFFAKGDQREFSPPRKKRNDLSPPRRKGNDISPPRKSNIKQEDMSPPRKRARDISPPRKRSNSDISPPRKKANNNNDISPPRKTANDISPPRRKPGNNDISPPRRKGNDISPPRRKSNDISPLRRKANDISPPRRKGNDLSPPRGNRDASPPRRSNIKQEETEKKQTHGLFVGKKGIEAEESRRDAELAAIRKADPRSLGMGAQTVYRDAKGRPLAMLNQMVAGPGFVGEESKMKWGIGEIDEEKQKKEEQQNEQESGRGYHAVYAEDLQVDEELRERDRFGDPMAKMAGRKKPKMRTFKGAYPANRFNIAPGWRWDGIDRSNGFESSIFKTANTRKANAVDQMYDAQEDM